MDRLRVYFICFFTLICLFAEAQVKIRIFSDQTPESVVFSVNQGTYELNFFNGESAIVSSGQPVIISKVGGRLAVKALNIKGHICDSIIFVAKTADAKFSIILKPGNSDRQYYSGDLRCLADLGTIVLINKCDIEQYLAGVVLAEGGYGRNEEFYKSQAVIARTYLYKYMDKHKVDGYNLCDLTHCQVYNGLSFENAIADAISSTKGLVILSSDSTLIISAFHSNCGGETSSSEDVWLTSQPYLKKVIDPFCLSSGNAKWETSLTKTSWLESLREIGYPDLKDDPSLYSFFQRSRIPEFKAGGITIQVRTIRTELNLRSTFFSVIPDGDSVLIRGRGYGHGVGLCQEGAMVMSSKGYTYKEIIDFYYTGVIISDIKNAVIKSE